MDGLWIKEASNTTKSINRFSFVDSLNGWAAGDSGLILHTSSGGALWEIQNTNTSYYVTDIRFLNLSTGWAIANYFYGWPNTTILKTTNSGINWVKYPFPDTTLLLHTICFTDQLTGWAGGYLGVIMKTVDGGISWTQHSRDSSQFQYNSLFRIKFYNNRIAVACGGTQDVAGVVWRIMNSGSNWPSQGLTPEPMYDIAYQDSNNIFCTGGDLEYGTSILKSTNSGINWEYIPLNFYGIGKAISFRTKDEAWIAMVGTFGFALTTNAGQNWIELVSPDSSEIRDVLFFDERNGWACGVNGALYKYNSALIGIHNYSSISNNNFIISNNYPNPFNPSTNISFRIFKNSFVKITVYDLLGNEIKTLTRGELKEGAYKFLFDGSDLPSGVYFCMINIADNIVTKKLVLLK